MKRRRATSRIRFYGAMNCVLLSMTGMNLLIGAVLLNAQKSELAGNVLRVGLIFPALSLVVYPDDRRGSNCFSRMIGFYVIYLALYALEQFALWPFVGFSWWLLAALVLENILFWRYFVHKHPRPL